jgi:3-phenylpropionate/trans-cinnamate dioxygenase ferredoxin reductase subunit
MTDPIVVVGAGQSGAQAAQTLRQLGYDGPLVLIGDEPHPPYQRPPLSKKFLAGEIAAEALWLRPSALYEKLGVDLALGRSVSEIDVPGHRLLFQSGESLAYSKLLLATGSRARALALAGANLPGVYGLRTIADVDRIRPNLQHGLRLVVIGGGYIGLEVAAVAARRGLDVTVLEAAPRVLARVVAAPVSTFLTDLHRAEGVDIRLNAAVSGIEGTDRATAVRLADGTLIPADAMLLAVGGIAETGLAEAAGLAVDAGILVDTAGRTSAPDIFAAGDCTRFPSARFGRMIRLESVQNAIDQAKIAAAALLGGDVSYDPVPWFWSDQYDVKLQIAGLSDGADRTLVEGDPASGRFSVSYGRSGRLVAVDTINTPKVHMLARGRIGESWPEGELA